MERENGRWLVPEAPPKVCPPPRQGCLALDDRSVAAKQIRDEVGHHPYPTYTARLLVRDEQQVTTRESQRLHPNEESRGVRDRKSTRLNSSHTVISYAVFCLKKKN